MDSRLGAVRRAAARAAPAALDDLESWLRIPSVSGSPEVGRAVAWVSSRLSRSGADVRRLPGPVVVARTPGRGGGTTVVYGHLDVKPPGPGWTSAPFGPTRRGHRLVARGASDDKGQLMPHLVALGAWARAGGPPGDVITIVDGAEEVGSPGLPATLRRARLSGPVSAVVVLDTRAAGPGRPTVTLTQRGAVPVHLSVDVGGRPVHAGRLGGAVVDPSLILATALNRASRWLVALPTPPPPHPVEPTLVAMRAAAGRRAVLADPVHGATRAGAITVNRLVARAAAGAIPTRADAWTDVRVPPGVDPADVVRRLRRELRRGLPPGVRLAVAAGAGGAGTILTPRRPVRAAVDDACRAAYGRSASSAASGGSVRAVEVLRDVFGQSPVLLGLGPADDGAHGPDEYLDLREWPAQVDVHTILLARIAAIRTPRSGQRFGSLPSVTVQRPAASWGSESALKISGVT